ncbi:MAG: ABC transporter ATP-binding protein [Acetobacteraceae bacterium]
MSRLVIRGLTKSYDGKSVPKAVDNVTLEIDSNQFLTLLGPSGCGKTTTLRLIAGYLTPDAGTIHMDDREISSRDAVVPPEHRRMGMVFQNYAVWPHKTVRDNVAFGLRVRKTPREETARRVDAILDLVNLPGMGNRFPNQLSGGQQQRVALARSLVVEPEILLLDEPLSNLDAKLREHMRSELKQLRHRAGITFIYVTHDQSEALALSDRIAVMHQGEVQQFGSPHDVYSHPVNKVVADFMGLVNFIRGRVVAEGPALAVSVFDGISVGCPVPDGARAGDIVDLAVRPEDVEISPVNGGGAGTGTIAEVVYLGNLVEYLVRVSSGELVRVQEFPRTLRSAGALAGLIFHGDRCQVFPASGADA